jgi:hypothetical protein
LIGLLIYVLLASVPYVGWFIALIATILGLGAVGVAFRDQRISVIKSDIEKEATIETSSVEGEEGK